MTLKRITCLILTAVLSVLCIASCELLPAPSTPGAGKTVQEIEYVSGSMDTEITVGEMLDTSTIQVKVTYSDNSTETIGASKLTIGAVDIGVVGTHRLAVSYEGVTIYVDVTVEAAEVAPPAPTVSEVTNVTGIETSVSLGATFDTSNVKATVKYTDGTSKVVGVADGLSVLSTVNTGRGGEYFVTVSYDGVIATPVKVVVSADFVGIELDSDSFDTNLYHTDEVNTSTIKINAIYSDGSRVVIEATDALVIDFAAISTDAIGEYSFNVTYTKDGTDYSIDVPYTVTKKLVSATLNQETIPTGIVLGDTVDTSGITVLATYSDGSTETVTADQLTISRINTSTSGVKAFSVKYQSFTLDAELSVAAKLVGIAYRGDDLVFVHALGSDSDPEVTADKFASYVEAGAIKIVLRYDHGTGTLEEQAVTLGADSDFTYEGLDTSSVGTGYMDIIYNGFSANVEFTVVKYLFEIALAEDNAFVSRIAHKSSADAALAGLKLIAKYSDGSTAPIDSSALEISGFTTETVVEAAPMQISYSDEFGSKSLAISYDIYKVFASIEYADTAYPTKYKPGMPVSDITTVAAKYIYSDGTFDTVEASIVPFELDTTIPGATATVELAFVDADGETRIGEFSVEVLSVKSLTVSGLDTYVPSWILDTDPEAGYVEELIKLGEATVLAVLTDREGTVYEETLSADALEATHEIVIRENGNYTVTLATPYYGEAKDVVTVGREIASIEIIENTSSYFQGGDISLGNLVIKAIYHDGTTEELAYKAIKNMISYEGFSADNVSNDLSYTLTYTENEKSASAVQNYVVYPAYDEATTDFKFSIEEHTIKVGDAFDFKAYGSFIVDGENVVDAEDFSCICNYNPELPRAGIYTVTVSYRGLTATMTLKVAMNVIDGDGNNVTDKGV